MAIKRLTDRTFIEEIYDYENLREWYYPGDKPAIVDFYAEWSEPCLTLSRILTELSEEYLGKVSFYEVNADEEREVSMAFGIRTIPTVLFIPVEGDPMMQPGALVKGVVKDVIDHRLLVDKNSAVR